MSELELRLQRLGPEVEWPPTPSFELRVRSRRRWPLVLALAALLALALAFAVPQSRGALLRFFHLGAASVERVETLPPADDRSLADSLGAQSTQADAAELLGRPFAFRGVRVYRSGRAVSTLLAGPLLFTELATGKDRYLIKKFAGASTHVRGVSVSAASAGLWIEGSRHVFMAPAIPPRFAGNALLWEADGITYRLEGARLTLEHALAVARRALTG